MKDAQVFLLQARNPKREGQDVHNGQRRHQILLLQQMREKLPEAQEKTRKSQVGQEKVTEQKPKIFKPKPHPIPSWEPSSWHY